MPERVTAALGSAVRCSSSYGQLTVDVPREVWVAAALAARDQLGLVMFDVLTAVDELEAGFDVVLRLWSPAERVGLLLRTRCPRDDARVPSLHEVFPGAAWHERSLAEMFGIDVEGHPDLRPLLLPDGHAHPLRKDVVLAARVARPWPGAPEPGESTSDTPARRRQRPPGVPAPGTWGPA